MSPQRLKSLGWRQGAVLPRDLTALILDGDFPDETRLIVISHDCDVTNTSLEKEPRVELLVARPVSPDDPHGGNYTWGKNQRKYQLALHDRGSNRPYRIQIQERMSVNRALLVDHAPDPNTSMDQRDAIGLARWMAKRYRRAALPDEFNRRRGPANSKIKTALRDGAEPIVSFYLAIQNEEKEPTETYTIRLLAAMRVEKYEDPAMRVSAETVLNSVVVALDTCEGIDVNDAQVISEADITLDDVRHLHELDEFENQSIRRDPVGDLSEY